MLLMPFQSMGQSLPLPENAKKYIPTLLNVIESKWPEQLDQVSVYAAQIERESCVSLTSKMCWNPRVGFKTSREEAFGFSQWTIVYGRFDKWKEVKAQFKDLRDWTDKYDASKQLLASVLMNRFEWSRVAKLNPFDRLNHTAMTLVAHNAGFGSILQDRKLCNAPCDKSKWLDNVEKNSYKSKVKLPGYGKSFFTISREYPRDILFHRRVRYVQFDRGVRQ